MPLLQLGERDRAHFLRRANGVREALRRRLASDDLCQGGGGFRAGVDHAIKLAAPFVPDYVPPTILLESSLAYFGV